MAKFTPEDIKPLIGKTVTLRDWRGNPKWLGEPQTGKVLEVGTHYPDEPGREYLLMTAPAIRGLSSNVKSQVGIASIEELTVH